MGNVGVPISGMPTELGMLIPLPEVGNDPDNLELVKLVVSGTLGIFLGISLEMDSSDISCLPLFLREIAREGADVVVPDESAKSMETASFGRKIRSRLLNEDEAPLPGSREVNRSCSVPGLRFPSVLMLNPPIAGFMEILILPAGSMFRPLRVIL